MKKRTNTQWGIMKLISGLILSLFINSCFLFLSEPLDAPDLEGKSLEDFFNSSFRYYPEHGGGEIKISETIEDVFYSSKLAKNYEISKPKYLGKDNDGNHYALIFSEHDIPVTKSNIILFFLLRENGDLGLYKIEENINGNYNSNYRAANLEIMTKTLSKVYSDGFFLVHHEKWTEQRNEQKERLAEIEHESDIRVDEQLIKAADSSRTPNRPRDIAIGFDYQKEIGVMIGHIPTYSESRNKSYGNPFYNIWTPYSNRGDRDITDGIYTFNFSRNTIINEFKPFLDWFKKSEEMAGGGKYHNNSNALFNAILLFLNQKSNYCMTEDQIGHPIFRIVSTDNSYRIYVYGYKDQSGAVKCIAVVVYNI
jgi:hypothetical protein